MSILKRPPQTSDEDWNVILEKFKKEAEKRMEQ